MRPEEELEPLYREQATLLAEHVDLLLWETMSSAAEARAAARGTKATGLPVWVSWTLADDGSARLRSGETIAQALEALADVGVDAVLVNCSTPERVGAVLQELASHAGRPFGAYANGFAPIAAEFEVADGSHLPARREDLSPERYAEHAHAWLAAGATIVGGCCEVGPEHVARLRELLPTR